MNIVLTAHLMVLAAAPAVASDTLLDPNAIRTWDIVVAESATEAEKYAAAEFRSLFEQASGTALPVVAEPGDRPGHVFIGPDVVKSGPNDLGDEDLHIRIVADRIDITGGRPRGTLYGVYEFFEKYLGVRFLTHDHTHVPKLDAGTRLPIGEYTYRPPLSFRSCHYGEHNNQRAFSVRKRLNMLSAPAKMGGSCNQRLIGHSFLHQIPTAKYGKEHPEYFAIHNGKRLNRSDNDAFLSEPCLTNPDVLDIVTQSVLDEIAKYPNRKNVKVAQNDNELYCECDNCAAIDKREGTPMGSVLAFVNAVAERIEAKHPDVMVGTLSYWYTRKAPKTIRPRKNVQIQLCSIECCAVHPLNDPSCEKNVIFARDLAAWHKITDQIWIWNYNTNFRHYDLPQPNLRVIEPNIRHFIRSNARGIYMQVNSQSPAGEMSDLRNYMISGLLWHPSASGQVLRDEFLDLHYREAAPAIRLYIDRLHDNAEARGVHPACFPHAQEVGLDPHMAAGGLDLFRHALAQTDDEVLRARIEKASISAYRGMFDAGATYQVQDGWLKTTFPARFGNIVNEYIALTKKYKMTRASEGGPIEDYYNRLKRNADGQPAVRLENDVLRVTLLPNRAGTIIELFHKPTGRHLIEGILSHRIAFGIDQGIDEWALAGYGHNNPWEFKAQTSGNSVHMVKTLPYGATIERTIRLADDAPEKIQCKTVLTHHGNPGHRYKFFLRCDFLDPIDVNRTDRVDAYVRTDRWHKVPGAWRERESEAASLTRHPQARAIALFNHDAKLGLAIQFDPKKTERVRLPIKSAFFRTDIEVLANDFRLNANETFEYEYAIELLTSIGR